MPFPQPQVAPATPPYAQLKHGAASLGQDGKPLSSSDEQSGQLPYPAPQYQTPSLSTHCPGFTLGDPVLLELEQPELTQTITRPTTEVRATRERSNTSIAYPQTRTAHSGCMTDDAMRCMRHPRARTGSPVSLTG
jgi:hypothetical protein